MAEADLIQLVQALHAPFGLERSVKLTHGVLADNRCLISIGRDTLGDAPAERLVGIGRTLGMPSDFIAELPAALGQAEIVHFGYEAVGARDIYKIYLEYASDVRRAMAAQSGIPVLVHLAYKWTPRDARGAAVTRYTWVPSRTRGEIETKVRDLVGADEAPRALRCALGLVSRAADAADSSKLMLMEVEEPGNPRRSFDLNVYNAQLHMRRIADLLDATMMDFAIPTMRGQEVFASAADKQLGHLSGGVGRDCAEFVTFYFGVEGH
ncbi:MAG TPA: hypothetical protein VH206_15475 [Xanthobacteraceae bacterium]|jgi:tryptophan halogenase|nr:hypothetical protein [Xanthobacteraceae bacterium]